MGQTLTNGIYLPSEGERNCYAGLAANWNAVDTLKGSYSAHAINVEIHVTTAEKTLWNTVSDKANDTDVVHKEGDESITGTKRFGDSQSFTGYPSIKLYSPTDDITVLPSSVEQRDIRFTDKNNVPIAYFLFQHRNDANEPFRTCWRQNKLAGTNYYYSVNFNNLGEFYPENNNAIKLGTSLKHWSGVYATNYYYGSNNVEFSTKFVTTDTNQVISGNKTFSENVSVYNSDTSVDAKYLILKNQKVKRGSTTETGSQLIYFTDKNNQILGQIEVRVVSNGTTSLNLTSYGLDSNNQNISSGVQILRSPTTANFAPNTDNAVTCGRALAKWSDVVTYKVNGVEPSSLSLPSDRSARIDISSYFTNTGTGQSNSYTVPANGYIYLTLSELTNVHCFSRTSGNVINYAQTFTKPNNSTGALYVLFPVRKNDVFVTTWYTTTTVSVDGAFFIPCQGNI